MGCPHWGSYYRSQRGTRLEIPVRQYWRLLVRYLKPQWPMALGLSVLLLSSIGLQLANPQLMRRFLDTAQAGGDPQVLLVTAALFLAVAVIHQVVSVAAIYVSENVAWTATNALRADVAGHCLRLDLSFHNAHSPGEMIERLDGDVTALSNFFSQFVVQVLGNGLLLIGVLALLAREDWRVGLTVSLFAAITVVALARLRNIAVPHWAAERQASAELFGFLEERLGGTEDIRANGAEAYVMRNFYRLMRVLLSRSLKAGLMVNILLNTMFVLFALGTAAAFGVGAWLFNAQVLTIGTVYIVFHYTNMLEQPIQQITRQLQDLQKAGAGIVRIEELLATPSRLQEAGDGLRLPRGPLAVELQDVSFSYRDDGSGADGQVVLRDVSFSLAPGSVLGLLGRTGSGKTTLTRLLFRFYDPDSGSIRLADSGAPEAQPIDIRRAPLAELRQRVGMVTQSIQLFHATVRENLTFFDDGIRDERIVEVIESVGLGAWYRALPQGLDTELDSAGGGLSAGEAQLLAFARVFLQDPGLVILDEASSRLDPATEALIESAVDRLVADRTAIVIAHRLGTVQRADEIMILSDGQIVEFGPRAALAQNPDSHFHGLLQTGLQEVLA